MSDDSLTDSRESTDLQTSTEESIARPAPLQLRRDTVRVFRIRSYLRAGGCKFNSGCKTGSVVGG
jgi:hypothetical protein